MRFFVFFKYNAGLEAVIVKMALILILELNIKKFKSDPFCLPFFKQRVKIIVKLLNGVNK